MGALAGAPGQVCARTLHRPRQSVDIMQARIAVLGCMFDCQRREALHAAPQRTVMQAHIDGVYNGWQEQARLSRARAGKRQLRVSAVLVVVTAASIAQMNQDWGAQRRADFGRAPPAAAASAAARAASARRASSSVRRASASARLASALARRASACSPHPTPVNPRFCCTALLTQRAESRSACAPYLHSKWISVTTQLLPL